MASEHTASDTNNTHFEDTGDASHTPQTVIAPLIGTRLGVLFFLPVPLGLDDALNGQSLVGIRLCYTLKQMQPNFLIAPVTS